MGGYKRMNLDGGGSTQMVSRPLGSNAVSLPNQTEYGTERKVVDGIGIWSTALKGQAKGLIIHGDNELFMYERGKYTLADMTNIIILLNRKIKPDGSLSNPVGKFEGNGFIPVKSGDTDITAR
ncbi:phosphodiester glycosidase family protein [Paenibacillus larvae]